MSNKDTIAAIYEAFGRGDIPFILSQLADDVEWDSWRTENSGHKAGVPWLKLWRGIDGVTEFFKAVETMGIYQFDVLALMEGENRVSAEVDIACKYFVDEEVHLWNFNADGKVTRFRHYVDTAKHIAGYENAEISTAA